MSRPQESLTSADEDADIDEPPMDPMMSPGSSVSSTLQKEYEDLLRFAIPQFGLDLQSPREESKTLNFPVSPPLVSNRILVSDFRKSPGAESGPRFQPNQTQLIEGFGNTGATLSDTLRFPPTAPQVPLNNSKLLSRTGPLLSVSDNLSDCELFGRHSEFDQDLVNLVHSSTADAGLIDTLGRWCNDLRRSLIEKSHNSKLELRDRAEKLIDQEKQRLWRDMQQLREENSALQETLRQHKQHLQARDSEIRTLQERIVVQQDKVRLARSFADWRIQQEVSRREDVLTKIADACYKRFLLRKTLAHWKSGLEATWRGLVEQSCEDKAMQVCERLAEECDVKVQSLSLQLQEAQEEASHEREIRETAEAAMRKALMRGVCALNMEAMSVLGPQQDNGDFVFAESNRSLDEAEERPSDESQPMNQSPLPSSRGKMPYQYQPMRSSLEKLSVVEPQRTSNQAVTKKRVSAKVLPQPQVPVLVETGFPTGTIGRINPQKHSTIYVEKHHSVGHNSNNMRIAPRTTLESSSNKLRRPYVNSVAFDRTVKIVD